MESAYLNELLKYINTISTKKGTIIVIKIEKICKLDRRCSWYVYKYMSLLETQKLAYRWKKGTWIIDKKNISLLESKLIELIPLSKKRKAI